MHMYFHAYMYHIICYTLLPNSSNNIINSIIDVKNKKLLLHSITVTAKSSKKMARDKTSGA